MLFRSSVVAYRFMAADRDDAALVARQWRQANPGQVWIAQRDDNRTLGQPSGQPRQSAAQLPGDAEGSIQYEMFDRTTDHIYRTYYAADDRMALDIGNRYRDELTAASGIGRGQVGLRRAPVRATAGEPQPMSRRDFNTLSQTDYENRLGWGDQTGDANYEIVDRRTNRRQMVFIANTDQDALRKFEQWLNVAGLPEDTEDFGFRAL